MSTTVYPGTTTKISCTDAPTGLAGTLKWQLKQGTTVIQARNASGVEEDPAGSGIYLVQVTWPTTTGRYRFIADTGTITPDTVLEEEIIVSYSRVDVPASDGPAYTTPDALRAALSVDDTVLTDEAADLLIVEAEDWIDSLLGGWPVDDTTGRKIDQDDVLAWQWEKLTRAATKAAAALYTTPTLLTSRQYRREKGPDFEVEDPLGGGALTPAITLLNASGLRRLAGRATAGTRCVPRERGFKGYP